MQLKQDALALLRDKELACHSGPQVYICVLTMRLIRDLKCQTVENYSGNP